MSRDGGAWDPDDVLVTVQHPFGDIEVPLAEWVRVGPGPRPGVRISRARSRSTGEAIPLSEVDDPWRPPRPGVGG